MSPRASERSAGVGQEAEVEGELGRAFVVVSEGGAGLGFASLNRFRRHWSRGPVPHYLGPDPTVIRAGR